MSGVPVPSPSDGECKVTGKPEVISLGWGPHDDVGWGTGGQDAYPGYAYEVRWPVENSEDCIVVQFIAAAWGMDGKVHNCWGSVEYPRLDNANYPREARYVPTEDYEWLVKRSSNEIRMYDRPGPGSFASQGTTFSLWFNAWPRLYSKKTYDEYSFLDSVRWTRTDGSEWQLDYPPFVEGSALENEPYHIQWTEYSVDAPPPDTDEGPGVIPLPVD
jgi:hypothetical protein